MNEKEKNITSIQAKKAKIRERYKGVDPDQLEIIPARRQTDVFDDEIYKRVAVYARVSTDDPRQTSSYELQKNYYTDMVSRHSNWDLVDIYADEGISGTSLKKRDSFNRMIADWKAGKIDLIVTKSVSRFARNIVDCISIVRMLSAMTPPVEVFFETEHINTLNDKTEMSLAFTATLAQEESHTKSTIMNASIEMRFSHGIFLTPPLLGYDRDEEGNLVINEDEAQTVRLIFFMYLYGYTCTQIAATLTQLGRTTKKGNTNWSAASILGVLKNERHCGDLVSRKTYTPSYLDHKSRKNRGERTQVRSRDHHEAIISRDDFIAVQRLISNAKYGNKGILPQLNVMKEGALRGFVNGVVGTLVVTETRTIPGYTIDPATKTQTVVVNPNDTQTLTFYNTPSTTLMIQKFIEGTDHEPLEGVRFLVTDSSGAAVGRSNGEYVTDEKGRIVITDLEPGTTVTAREVKTVEGYVLDGTPKSILIKEGEVQTLSFWNKKQGTIVIQKRDSVSGKPLAGVEFKITYADGSFVDDANGHLSSKGLYTTDENGEIRISGVTGTLVVKETKPLDGYVVDPATQTQTVQVNPDDTQTLTFYNTPVGGLQIVKSDENTGKRISGVKFEIRKMNGEILGTYTTDRNGVIRIPEAESGWYSIVELKAADGYELDATPVQACVKDGETTTVEITNQRMASIMIHKVDANTGKGIYGVKFVIYDAGKNPIMEVETDQDG